MDSGDRWRLGHRPGLDGLRGIAILLVLVGHFASPSSDVRAISGVGVTLFFTLSGFLITALLLEERANRGGVSLGGFYARRARRLLPALLVMVTIVGALQAAAGIQQAGSVWWVFSYLGNWPAAGGHSLGFLVHTWSLAIEEQFYLVWPLALGLVWRWRTVRLLAFVAGLAAASTLWRFWLWGHGATSERIYFGSDTRADTLLVGCLLAIALHRGIRLRLPGWAVASAVALVAVVGVLAYGPAEVNLWLPIVVPLLTAAAIVSLLTSPGVFAQPALRYLGRRSYGLYLWHYPVMTAVTMFDDSIAARMTAVAISFGLAELSWRLVESPFLLVQAGNARSSREQPVQDALARPRGRHQHVVNVAGEL